MKYSKNIVFPKITKLILVQILWQFIDLITSLHSAKFIHISFTINVTSHISEVVHSHIFFNLNISFIFDTQ